MSQRSPPLAWIEAFVIGARANSFREAADRLALSPSAFSRRMQNLEHYLQQKLFVRNRHRAQLTAAGQQYLAAIEPAMDTLGRATRDFRVAAHSGALRIRSPHSLAISWLMPRIPDFLSVAPHLDVDITIGRGLEELRAGAIDAVICNGPADLCGFPNDRLIDLDAVIVSAPSLAQGQPPPRMPQDLNGYRVLGVPHAPRLWWDWTRRAGLDAGEPAALTYYETLSMMYEAAAAGLGITLGLPLFTEKYFADGRLRPRLAACQPTGFWYALVYASEAVRRRREMRLFCHWLLQEIAQSRVRFHHAVEEAMRDPPVCEARFKAHRREARV
jgi:DNA-binding transcriptional LysR family regulator